MPKKPPPNSFYYYMKDMQNQMKERGQRVPSMREMPALVSPQWNRMSAEEKAPYEAMAKAYKRNRANTDDGRFTSDGIPIQFLKQQEAEAEESVRAIETAIRSLIKTFPSTDHIAQSSFFIMGFNILIGTLEDLYLPNEIGIVEYSIQDGIKNEYHKFIDPGPIPIGYTSAAKQCSETVHDIPISGFALASADYSKLYKDVRRFLGVQTHAETRYIFCHPEQLHQFQHCLDWLKENSGIDSKEEIVFANLAVLVIQLKAAVNQPYQYTSTATDDITSNSFDYSPNTLCGFHDQKDNKNCALGYCKRLAYVLSDILCLPYNVEVTSNHFPQRLAPAESTVWEPKREIRPVVNKVDLPLKPVTSHVPTTIIRNVRSKFDDDDVYCITPSAMSETSSVTSENVQLEDEAKFPSLVNDMTCMSLDSSIQSVNSGPSWAQVSSKPKPMRLPRTVPESLKQMEQVAVTGTMSSVVNNSGRGAGIGRGRGLKQN